MSWLLCVFIILDIFLTFLQVMRVMYNLRKFDIIDITYDYTIQVDFQLAPHFYEKVSTYVKNKFGPLKIVKGI